MRHAAIWAALAAVHAMATGAWAQQEPATQAVEPPVERGFDPGWRSGAPGVMLFEKDKFNVDLSGYVRLRASFTEGDRAAPFVGRNNGFGLANVRLEATARYGSKLWLRIGLDGAYDRGAQPANTVTPLGVGLKDGYLAYEPWRFLRVTAGQFKAPFDREDLTSTRALMFATRAVESTGVRATEGFFVPGLSRDRELGMQLSGEGLAVGGPVSANYYLAVTNGNGPNRSGNDNRSFAFWGRGVVDIAFVHVGAAAFFNPETAGVFPNLFEEQRIGVTGDVVVDVKGFQLLTQFMFVQARFPSTGAQVVSSMGGHAQVGYRFWFGLTPAYRIAWYEPSDRVGADQLLYHTIGLAYELPWVPVKVLANGTLAGEQPGRAVHNNQLDFLIQASFP